MDRNGFANVALIVLVVILAGVGGYFVFLGKPASNTQPPPTPQSPTTPVVPPSPSLGLTEDISPKDRVYIENVFKKSNSFEKCHGQCETEAVPYIQGQRADELVKSVSITMTYLIDTAELQEAFCSEEDPQIRRDYVFTADNRLQMAQSTLKTIEADEKIRNERKQFFDIFQLGYRINEKLYTMVISNNVSACFTVAYAAEEFERKVDSLNKELWEKNLSLMH